MAQHRLILVSVVLIGAMLVLVPWLTRSLGALLGYGIVFGIYWFGFCLPFGLAFQGLKQARQNLSLAVSSAPWVPWAVAGQVFLVALASWAVLPEQVPLIAVCVAAVAGLINGFAEEFYWRGAFLVQSQGSGGIRQSASACSRSGTSLWRWPMASHTRVGQQH